MKGRVKAEDKTQVSAIDDDCSGKGLVFTKIWRIIFNKRQALSRAVVVNSNMSLGKYLAREGPGSRLTVAHPAFQDEAYHCWALTVGLIGVELKLLLERSTAVHTHARTRNSGYKGTPQKLR